MKNGENRSLRKISKKQQRTMVLTLFVLISLVLIWGIYSYGYLNSPVFWIACVIEVILAGIVAIPKRLPRLRLMLLVVAVSLPTGLAINIESLNSLKMSWLVFCLAGLWLGYYKSIKLRKI
ncbi:MAG: hypothetical protein PHR56_01580 [Dehalococcoidales bacterium]|nr:hypothetical protein [Dehalococcoidales bacterium]